MGPGQFGGLIDADPPGVQRFTDVRVFTEQAAAASDAGDATVGAVQVRPDPADSGTVPVAAVHAALFGGVGEEGHFDVDRPALQLEVAEALLDVGGVHVLDLAGDGGEGRHVGEGGGRGFHVHMVANTCSIVNVFLNVSNGS